MGNTYPKTLSLLFWNADLTGCPIFLLAKSDYAAWFQWREEGDMEMRLDKVNGIKKLEKGVKQVPEWRSISICLEHEIGEYYQLVQW